MVRQTRPKSHIVRSLTGLGLSDNEARVYMALLRSGPSEVAEIARAAEIKRTTAYSVLESLTMRGYVTEDVHPGSRRYVAEHPQTLSSMLNSKLQEFNDFLPDLTALFNSKGGSADTRIYSGIEASKGAYNLLLASAKPGEDYLIISDVEKWYSLDPKFFGDFVERRAKLGLHPRHVFTDSKAAQPWLQRVRRLGAFGKILPKGISFSINLVIIPKMVVIHQLIPPVQAIVIESPIVAQMMSVIFEVVWRSLPGDGTSSG